MKTQEFNEEIARRSAWVSEVKMEMGNVVIGQQHLVNRLILSLLCKGHVLLEGVPGLAKTLSVKALAGAMHAAFSRIQFTPDLLPADLIGTMIYNPQERQFTPKRGPIFANQSCAGEGSERLAGGHAGETGDLGRDESFPAEPVPRAGDAEPD